MKKNDPIYPSNGIFGINILHAIHKALISGREYSMKAITQSNFLLTIKLKGEEGVNWSFSTSKRNGWFVEPFDSTKKEQIFRMDEDSKAEIALNIQGEGRMIIEFYKNSEGQAFDSKEIVWS